MLKKRILTAIILIPIFIAFLLQVSNKTFALITAVLVLLAGREWSQFMGVTRYLHTFIFPIVLLLIGALLFYLYSLSYFSIQWIMIVTFFCWILFATLIFIYPQGSKQWGSSIPLRSLMGIITLIPAWIAINYIRQANQGIYALLCLFILIWGADSAAYFAGRIWGKTPLAPAVSPGKTVEGLVGALVSTLLIVVSILIAFKAPSRIWLGVIAISVITVIFSVIGDLFESMLKRNVGLKDSGNILPGHGGILDRIDSLTAAAPIFLLGVLVLGKIYQH